MTDSYTVPHVGFTLAGGNLWTMSDVQESIPADPEAPPSSELEPAPPWWHSPWRLLVLGAAVLFLGLAAGYALFNGDARPKGSAVDIGFLQDMHAHHDQAVTMSYIYLEKPAAEQRAVLRSIAKTIISDQQYQSGYMAGLLLEMGRSPANETGQAMAWMNEPVPLDRMPGMATTDELDQLQAASGPAADQMFVDLMRAHHLGGIHMAEYAAQHAKRGDVRSLAAGMVTAQRGEIVDLQNALALPTG
jgi:uncharacterized protein (DUF305 family)